MHTTVKHCVAKKRDPKQCDSVTNPNQKLLAPFCPCSDPGCECAGYAYLSRERFELEENELMECNYGFSSCSTCGHFLENHVSHLNDRKDDDLEIFYRIIMDCRDLYLLAQETDCSIIKEICLYVCEQMSKCPAENNLNIKDYLQSPVGELVHEPVSIIDLICMVHLPDWDIRRHKNASSTLLNILNKEAFPSPMELDFEDNTDEFKEYLFYYRQWVYYCDVPKFCCYLDCYETAQIFGPKFMRLILCRIGIEFSDKCDADALTLLEALQKLLDTDPELVPVMADPTLRKQLQDYDNNTREKELLEIKAALENGVVIIEDEDAESRSGDGHSLSSNSKPSEVDEEYDESSDMLDFVEEFLEIKNDPRVKKTIAIDVRKKIKCHVVSSNHFHPRVAYTADFISQFEKIVNSTLPKMGKEYVEKVVWDFRHTTLVLSQFEGEQGIRKVIAGICFREFKKRGFAEIVFCAVDHGHQAKGYGTLVMTLMKTYMNIAGIRFMLTYADNDAEGYFKKHGFQETIPLDEGVYKNYIKQYDGAKLMGIELYPCLDYSILNEIIQFLALVADIRAVKMQPSREKHSKVHAGIEHIFKENERMNAAKVPFIPIKEILGDDDVFPCRSLQKLEAPTKDFEKKALALIKDLRAFKKWCWPFENPVTDNEVEGYSTWIKNPICLSIIEHKINSSKYNHEHGILADVKRIWNNAYFFNGHESEFYAMALCMHKKFNHLISKYFPNNIIDTTLPPEPSKEAMDYCK
uniref:Histone acetyltransferase n=1 Tax=Rhabditophanes sp. KR3021 TaxID=114890 RepID=A0AC35U263_9BILA